MEIANISVCDLKPYENNPRVIDEDAITKVMNSINEFGFKVPILIDENLTIIAGHTRLKAAERLGLLDVPCIMVEDLTEDQIKAFRLADNKVAEYSKWDWDKLDLELQTLDTIDMEPFGIIKHAEMSGIEWDDVDDLEEGTYKEPTEHNIKCPHCGYVGSKHYFVKATEADENIS